MGGLGLGKTRAAHPFATVTFAFPDFPDRVAMSSLKDLKAANPTMLSTGHVTASHFYSRKQKDEASLGLFWSPAQRTLDPQREREKVK